MVEISHLPDLTINLQAVQLNLLILTGFTTAEKYLF